MGFQRGKIREIGDAWETDDRDVNRLFRTIMGEPRCEGVLIIQIHRDIRDDADHRNAGFLCQHVQSGR